MFSSLRILLLLLAGCLNLCSAYGQGSLHFVGIYREKAAGVRAECQSQRLEHQPVSSQAQYEHLRASFLIAHAEGAPGTVLLRPNQATLVYSYTTSVFGSNCRPTLISWQSAASVDEARRYLDEQVQNNPSQFQTPPAIELNWAGQGPASRPVALKAAVAKTPALKPTGAKAPGAKASPASKAHPKLPAKATDPEPTTDEDDEATDPPRPDLSCAELRAYHAHLLTLLAARRRVYALRKEPVETIQTLRRELLEETSRGTSDWNLIPMTGKLLADALSDLLNAASPQGKLLQLAEMQVADKLTRRLAYEVTTKGRETVDLALSESIDVELAKQTMYSLGRIGAIASFYHNVYDNINNFQDHDELKKDVRAQLTALDKALAEYEAKLAAPQASYQELDNYLTYSSNYLAAHCKDKKK